MLLTFRSCARPKKVIANIAAIAMVLGPAITAAYADTPPHCPTQPQPDTISQPYLAGPLYQPNMLVASLSTPEHKTWILPATPATTQWGVFDATVPPALAIKSGDTVAIETLPASNGQVVPGITIDKLMWTNTENGKYPNRGPHTVTGPIHVSDAEGKPAEPGDVVAIHINKIVMRSYATNNSSCKGGLFWELTDANGAPLFPPRVDSYYLDTQRMIMQFEPHVVVPLKPFPGILAVAPPPGKCPDDGCNTVPPGDFGGNLDLPALTVGTTLYLPVFNKGALIWTGDSHAAQGNGEIALDALETAFPELNVTITLIRNQPQMQWPVVETPSAWITVGYQETLDDALEALKKETVRFIMEKRHISRDEAEKTMLKTWNCPISEVVDRRVGTYCIIPKQANAPKASDIPKKDNDKYWVTYASDPNLMTAMKAAALSSIYKMSEALDITPDRAYRLANFVQDCRIGRPLNPGIKEVACMVPKSILVKSKRQ